MRLGWLARSAVALASVGIAGTVVFLLQESTKESGVALVAIVTFVGTIVAFLLGMWSERLIRPTDEELARPGSTLGRICASITFLLVTAYWLLHVFRADFVPMTLSAGDAVHEDAQCTGRLADFKICNQDPEWSTATRPETVGTFHLVPDPKMHIEGLDGSVRVWHVCGAELASLAPAMLTNFTITIDGKTVSHGTVHGEGVTSIDAVADVPSTAKEVTLSASVDPKDPTGCARWVVFSKILQRNAWGPWQ